MSSSLTNGLDETQVKLLQEECILIDKDDNNVGVASKKTCHLLKNIDNGMLHRAFSVFLFNSNGELLLQQRSDAKITYPGHWTNTCCSHPLSIVGETDEEAAIGVKRAARRKLEHELGISTDQILCDDFTFLTRIHYKAPNAPQDDTWGEHEVDYILFAQKDVDLSVNNNEVQDVRYVDRKGLLEILELGEQGKTLVTPWFKLIANSFLEKWWDHLHDLNTQKDQETIHRMI